MVTTEPEDEEDDDEEEVEVGEKGAWDGSTVGGYCTSTTELVGEAVQLPGYFAVEVPQVAQPGIHP